MANDLVFVGAALADLNYWLPYHLDADHWSVQATHHHLVPGGKGLLQAAAASRLLTTKQMQSIPTHVSSKMQKVFLVARIGDDGYGVFLQSFLQQNQVDTTHVRIHPKRGTGSVAILNAENGPVRYIGYLAAAEDVSPDYITSTSKDAFVDHGIIISTFDIPFLAINAAFSLKKKGAISILNPSPPLYDNLEHNKLSDIFRQADIIVSSPEDLTYLLGMQSDRLDEIALTCTEHTSAKIIVTDGYSKAILVSQRNKKPLAFEDTSNRWILENTSGTVDIFIGALAIALSEGTSLDDAIPFALVSGTLSTSSQIKAYACPARDTVDILLSQHPPVVN